MEEELLQVKDYRISPDRKTIYLQLPQIKPGHVIYLHLDRGGIISADGDRLWSTEAWYTMNKIPSRSVEVNH